MPLSRPAERQHLHTRAIVSQGFRRSDGMWDIEARLTDTKTYGFANAWRGEIAPGEPIHDMWLRLTVDDDFIVREIEVATDAAPFEICPAIAPNFQRIVGQKIGPGWNRRVKSLLGGIEGCTHLVELLGASATVVYQTLFSTRARQDPERASAARARKPMHLDTCHALASDGEIVRRHYPEFYVGGANEPPRD